MAGHFQRHWPVFDADAFIAAASDGLERLELKARSQQVVQAMADYVGLHGQAHFDLAMGLLKIFTSRFSSEFGMRFFLLQQPDRVCTRVAQQRAWQAYDVL